MRADLKHDLEAAGLLQRRTVETYAKGAVLLVLTIAFLAGFFLAPSWWLKAILLAAGVWTNVGLIMIGHESGHGTISARTAVNEFPGYLLFAYVAGLSFNYWRYKHNQHHAHCNVSGRDPDIKIFPMAFRAQERIDRSDPRWFIHRSQGVMFWVLTLFTSFAIRFDAIHFYVLGPGRRIGRLRERLLDQFLIVAHYVTWLVVPIVFFHAPVRSVLTFYVLWGVVAGVLMAAIFVAAHTPFPIYSSSTDNVALQLETTQNLRTNAVFSWLMIGLDQQVEHHLFPRMSHMSFRKAAPIVRAHCARAELPYREATWGSALWRSTMMLQRLPFYEPAPQPARPEPVVAVPLESR